MFEFFRINLSDKYRMQPIINVELLYAINKQIWELIVNLWYWRPQEINLDNAVLDV